MAPSVKHEIIDASATGRRVSERRFEVFIVFTIGLLNFWITQVFSGPIFGKYSQMTLTRSLFIDVFDGLTGRIFNKN